MSLTHMTEVQVRFRCLCGRINETSSLKVHEQRAEPRICHCNSCRRCTGALFSASLAVTARPSCVTTLLVRRYQQSANITRFFCETCGSHVCLMKRDPHQWYISAGCVEQGDAGEHVDHGLRGIGVHQFVEDTLDGGLASYLSHDRDHLASERLLTPRRPASDQVQAETAHKEVGSTPDKLRARCHCGGIDFWITRPNEVSEKCSSPWPDLLRPYHILSSENPADVKWWIRGSKYFAGTCACRTCRLANATALTTWAFIPKANLECVDGGHFRFGIGTMQAYESSPDTFREFCNVCGSSLFWHSQVRPELLDVSVGILRAEEGALATKWLEWWQRRVSFSELAQDTALVSLFESRWQTSEVPNGLPIVQQAPP